MNKKLRKFILRAVSSIIIFLIFMYATTFICSVPPSFSMSMTAGKIYINHPINSILEFTNQKFLSLLHINLGTTTNGKSISSTIMPYIKRSAVLLLCGMLLGTVLGILKGVFDSRRKGRETTAKLLLSIIPLSLPDILIVALLQCFAIWLSQHGIKIFKVAGAGSIKHLILPVIAVALPSACYIARVTALSIEECYTKEYVKIAKGKGCSEPRILWNHVMKNVVGIILKGLSNSTAMIISNMLIVEYLFAYPGLTMLLVKLLTTDDRNALISVIIIIGLIYLILDIIIRLIKLSIDKPLKEETV